MSEETILVLKGILLLMSWEMAFLATRNRKSAPQLLYMFLSIGTYIGYWLIIMPTGMSGYIKIASLTFLWLTVNFIFAYTGIYDAEPSRKYSGNIASAIYAFAWLIALVLGLLTLAGVIFFLLVTTF